MKYILDKNLLSNYVTKNEDKRDDLCITEDVLDEAGFDEREISKIKSVGVQILRHSKKHLEKLGEIMSVHGNNLRLINLYTGKGTADVAMIAHVLAERERPATLFTEEFVIVTNDKELSVVAKAYGITCVSQLP